MKLSKQQPVVSSQKNHMEEVTTSFSPEGDSSKMDDQTVWALVSIQKE